MSIEDDLFNMMKHMDIGRFLKPDFFSSKIAKAYELGVLKKMEESIKKIEKSIQDRIAELSKQEAMRGFTDSEMDPFAILGVSMNATEQEVKEAYRKKAREVHPDYGGSTEEMVKVNAAYEVICKFKGWR